MIFKDLLEEKINLIRPEIKTIFENALSTQAHNGDLLLVYGNGYYNPENLSYQPPITPYGFGNNRNLMAERTNNQFIDSYRKSHFARIPFKEYSDQFKNWSAENAKELQSMEEAEGQMIQFEMLVYLKFWEMDNVIKRLYQLAIILERKPYDWHFKILNSWKKNRSFFETGTREQILEEIVIPSFRKVSSIIANIIEVTYIRKFRNAVAHANYFFLGRSIQLTNEDSKNHLVAISFDEWINIFHNTLALHNELIGLDNDINAHYKNIASTQNNKIDIKIIKEDLTSYISHVEFDDVFEVWRT